MKPGFYARSSFACLPGQVTISEQTSVQSPTVVKATEEGSQEEAGDDQEKADESSLKQCLDKCIRVLTKLIGTRKTSLHLLYSYASTYACIRARARDMI